MTDELPEDPEWRRLGDTTETLIRLHVAGDAEGFRDVWENLTGREQRLVASALAALIHHYRQELGHPPDAEYGPE